MTPDFMGVTMSDGEAGPIRAMNSLREHHFAALARAFSPWLGRWSLDRHEGYDGDLTVVLSPADDNGPNLVFSRSSAGFHAGILQADVLCELGCFASLDALIAAACEILPGNTRGPRRAEPKT